MQLVCVFQVFWRNLVDWALSFVWAHSQFTATTSTSLREINTNMIMTANTRPIKVY